MKYSIILPYCKRKNYLYNTLISFKHHYNRNDYEVVIIEDYKNYEDTEEHIALHHLIAKFRGSINISWFYSILKDCYNPAPLFNLGAQLAVGKFFVISNPECFHSVDILSGLDEEFDVDENCYVICACEEVINPEGKIIRFENFKDFNFVHRIWFQHSKHNNRGFHFCSAISKDKYHQIDGFDDKFALGAAYDDNDFRDNVIYHHIPIKLRDDLVACHMRHGSDIYIPNIKELVEINKRYYFDKLNKRNIKLEFNQ